MSAMGERFLLLEMTADALDGIDPGLATQFRFVNGLPLVGAETIGPDDGLGLLELPADGAAEHVASMDEGPDGIRVSCSCGRWSAAVDWDEIDELVVEARAHFGPNGGSFLRAGSGVGVDGKGEAGVVPPSATRRVS